MANIILSVNVNHKAFSLDSVSAKLYYGIYECQITHLLNGLFMLTTCKRSGMHPRKNPLK